MVKMTAEIVKSTKLPVTVKTRLGWDDKSKYIVEVAERLKMLELKLFQFMVERENRCTKEALIGH